MSVIDYIFAALTTVLMAQQWQPGSPSNAAHLALVSDDVAQPSSPPGSAEQPADESSRPAWHGETYTQAESASKNELLKNIADLRARETASQTELEKLRRRVQELEDSAAYSDSAAKPDSGRRAEAFALVPATPILMDVEGLHAVRTQLNDHRRNAAR